MKRNICLVQYVEQPQNQTLSYFYTENTLPG